MKTVLALTILAAGTALADPAFAASLFGPTKADKAICDPIFASLERHERDMLVAQADTAAPANQKTEAELTQELSALLQACSYDGRAIKVDPAALAAAGGGEETVRTIMRFTGLPQNFRVMEGDVPNAAALIVMGEDRIPVRVIAYSRSFMEQVRTATENNDWASISIMAHEIGHHLSGHTLMPGGSQPPIELEADKFSGYVLFKMGASLPDAQKAIATLVPEEDGPTHPGRPKRLAAIDSGWMESCEQQQTECGPGSTLVAVAKPAPAAPETAKAPLPEPAPPAASAPPGETLSAENLAGQTEEQLQGLLIERMNKLVEPGADVDAIGKDIERINEALSARIASAETGARSGTAQMPKVPGPADIRMPGDPKPEGFGIVAATDRLPPISADATPSKFDRFVYDEVGTFDVATKTKLAKLAFDYAAANNIEIVTIVTDDLKGMTADAFALAAMRQLRVGKMDVGNGAVLVVAPKGRQTGVALGPGLLVEYEDTSAVRGYLESYLKLLDGGTRPDAAGELIADASYRIMRDTKSWEWVVKFPTLNAMLETQEAERLDIQRTGRKYDPKIDPTWRKILRVEAAVVTRSPDKADKVLDVNTSKEEHIGPAMHVRTADGKDAVLYVNPSVPALMPVALEEGRIYAFVVRESFAAADTPQFDLISYDLIR